MLKSNGTSVISPVIKVSVSKKNKRRILGKRCKALNFVAIGIALTEMAIFKGVNFGAHIQ